MKKNLIIFLLFSMVFYSCKTHKKVVETTSSETKIATTKRIIKSINNASYSVKRSGILDRIVALKSKNNKDEYFDKNGKLIEYLRFRKNF